MFYDSYRQDMNDSLAVEKFCDSTIYLLDGVFSNLVRERDLSKQHAGIDLTVNVSGIGNIIIDEKATTRSMRKFDRKFDTCLIELTNNRVPEKFWPQDKNPDVANVGKGWFMNPNSATEYYFYIFPSLKFQYNGYQGPIEPDFIDMYNFHCYLVSKTSIKKFVQSKGLTESRTIKLMKKFLDPNDKDVKTYKNYQDYRDPQTGIRFYRSISSVKEQSISICLEPFMMEKISLLHADFFAGKMNAFTPTGQISQKLPKYVIGQQVNCDIYKMPVWIEKMTYIKQFDSYYYQFVGGSHLVHESSLSPINPQK